MQRRGLLAGAAALFASGCSKVADSAVGQSLFGAADGWHRAAQRRLSATRWRTNIARRHLALLPRQRLDERRNARLRRTHRGNGFADWRLDGHRAGRTSAVAQPREHPQAAPAHPDHPARLRRGLERDRRVDRPAAVDDPRQARSCCPRRATSCSAAPTRWTARAYYESIDLDDAFHPQTIVAHALNGEPLPVTQRRAAAPAGRAPARLQARQVPDGDRGGRQPRRASAKVARAAIGKTAAISGTPVFRGSTSMWLLDKFLSRAIRRGRLIVTDHDGKATITAPARRSTIAEPLRIRLTDPKAANHIARYPQVGAGEAYMWGWLVVEEPHDIRDLVLFVTMNARNTERRLARGQGPAAQGGAGAAGEARQHQPARQGAQERRAHLQPHPPALRAVPRRGPAIHDGLLPRRSGGDILEQAQLDKKAHMAAKMYMKPGMKVLDIGCGWGGFALYLHKHYGCRSARRSARPGPDRLLQGARGAEGVADKVKFALMDYRDVEGTVRPDQLGRPARARRHPALSAVLRAHQPTAQARRGDVQPLLRPRRGVRAHRRLDPQVHLPRRLYPGAERARHPVREGTAGR